MHSHTVPRLVAVLLSCSIFAHAPRLASADDGQGQPPSAAPVMVPVYPAPLSQTTQTTYVPQSVALSGPEEITDVGDDQAAPLGYSPVLRTRKGLIIGGAVTFGVTYGISAMVAAIGEDTRGSGENEVGSMWIPVAGPFLQLGKTESATASVFLVGLGGAQLAGAIMLYYGLTSQKRVFVRNDLVGLTISPMAGIGNTGMMLSGQF
jgi:hypothetical protein